MAAAAVVFAVSAGAAISSAAQDAKADGAGSKVLAGVYTDEQAKRGEVVSNKLCTSCHGPDLSGGEARMVRPD